MKIYLVYQVSIDFTLAISAFKNEKDAEKYIKVLKKEDKEKNWAKYFDYQIEEIELQ